MTSDAGRDQTPAFTIAWCPRNDSAPHHPHYWGDPEVPTDDRWCPGALPSADASGCVVAGCTYSASEGSAYCTLHGVKWGRGGSDDASRQTP